MFAECSTCHATDQGRLPAWERHAHRVHGGRRTSLVALVRPPSSVADGDAGVLRTWQDPDDTYTIARARHTNSVDFVCPTGGEARFRANFEDESGGLNYRLRGTYLHVSTSQSPHGLMTITQCSRYRQNGSLAFPLNVAFGLGSQRVRLLVDDLSRIRAWC
ncbi:hypothetical protein BD413DRAFT_590194 [Trametes elegans]|nr:hypothetical protein BD413DRAFT_590194 [Trametes elegans]